MLRDYLPVVLLAALAVAFAVASLTAPNVRMNRLPTSVTPPAPDELARLFAGLGFVTRSPRLAPLLQQVWKVARVSDAPVLKALGFYREEAC